MNTRSFKRHSPRTQTGPPSNQIRAALDPPVYHLGVFLHGEGTPSRRLPDVLFVVIVQANDTNLVRNQVGRREARSKLPDHENVAASTHGLQERLGTRLGEHPEIVHELAIPESSNEMVVPR